MVSVLPPDLSTTFIVAAVVPLIIGFVVGIIARNVIKIGIALVALVILLIALGTLTPGQVLAPLVSLVKSGSASTVSAYASRVAGYLPYSSLTFIVGLAIGWLKG